jgi:nucleotide-binding universal stress UspA family protein
MRILWALDGSEKARHAGRMILDIADPEVDELIALAVVPSDPLPWLQAPLLGTGHQIDSERERQLERALREGVEGVPWPATRTRCRVECGDVARVILAVAKEDLADLVVLGARQRTYDGELIGPTCSEVLLHASCPVLVADAERDCQNVLFGTDGSDGARGAETFLASLDLHDAVIHVRTVAADKVPAQARPTGVSPIAEDEMGLAIVEAAADRLQEEGFMVTRVVRPGRPAPTLVAMAREVDADLVVLGTHGRTGWRRAVMGSVAGEVARTAGTSLLIVPSQKPEA